jgi:hypothetical protein
MKGFLTSLSILSFAQVALAAAKPQTIGDVFQGFSEGNLAGLIPSVVAVGLVTFLVGVLGFIRAGDDAEKRASGQKVMVFGIVVLFIMLTYWGFVGFFTQSFFAESPALPNYLPKLMGQ